MSASQSTPTYWDVEWVRHSAKQLSKDSYENKVDQMWSCVFFHVFPFSEGYLVFIRDRVDSKSPKAADVIVKHLSNGVVSTILTMENKRVGFEGQDSKWAEAAKELQEYLDLVPQESKPNPKLEVGLGIGHYVRIYRRSQGTGLEDYPRSGGKAFHIEIDAKRIEKLLREIKEKLKRE